MRPDRCSWDLDLIYSRFDPFVASAISRVEIGGPNSIDELIWRPATNDNFTAKSMYKSLLNLKASTSAKQDLGLYFNWHKLWAIKGISPRVVHFLWRSLHGGIPVNDRVKNFYGGNGCCIRCGDKIESVDHVLITCPFAGAVWANCTSSDFPLLIGGSLHQRFEALLSASPEQYRRGASAIWCIWGARNELLFSGNLVPPEQVAARARRLADEYERMEPEEPHQSRGEGPHLNSLVVGEISLKWRLPPAGTVKINVDGAFAGDSMASAFVVRDEVGRLLHCESSFQAGGSAVQAEAFTFSYGAEMDSELGSCFPSGGGGR